MKKPQSVRTGFLDIDEMPAEYDFDYSKAKPNRFAKGLNQQSMTVCLDPDVAQVFRSSEQVNRFLRASIRAMPARSKMTASTRRRRSREAVSNRASQQASQ